MMKVMIFAQSELLSDVRAVEVEHDLENTISGPVTELLCITPS
jgi:hypothetical protein